ncbi:hypothetical protein [Streptomyces omiyaensis]|uniref:Uncharacterized protein n=1 Tax=Streptomyces omiyaensis TaxID=68247 RepID=A0ABW7BXQ0_9ACTN|nr:hypothetical protein [Streptomyces omiyaensis]GGY66531.1 hypothetical protein GCM10010363_54830 [Streptomyces omiyaensis]
MSVAPSPGRPFPADPDAVERLRTGAPLNPLRDGGLVCTGGAEGYADRPAPAGPAAVPA